jgi:hypothetical protein
MKRIGERERERERERESAKAILREPSLNHILQKTDSDQAIEPHHPIWQQPFSWRIFREPSRGVISRGAI